MKNLKVLLLDDVKDDGGAHPHEGYSHKKGETVEFREDRARFWIDRGKAVVAPAETMTSADDAGKGESKGEGKSDEKDDGKQPEEQKDEKSDAEKK